ncbi:sucrose-6-phosphate hydrolase [Holzapfeliella sp. He02]|uniref:Sucrose-6-phosphate hydrolase n=1 Tax=Holzapfeliella saturejae TaxID=3082953 RepID=A0ABU8SF83_9LACO
MNLFENETHQNYLRYHIYPKQGLLNDPNGLCYFNGEYHVFYQLNEEKTDHSVKAWGHATSKDLVHFERQEVALRTGNNNYDSGGIFSGSAVVHNNQLYLFYTGVIIENGEELEAYQCLATSKDGRHFEKQGPLFENPKGYHIFHVRDPKVWLGKDHKWHMVIGAQLEETVQGDIIHYQSDDLLNWDFTGSIFEANHENLGFMYECPDLIPFDEQDVLVFSPQGIANERYRFQNNYHSGYFVGRFNYETAKFEVKSEFEELDYGFEYYAPQSFTHNHEVIQYGWMGMMPTEKEQQIPSIKDNWVHNLTMPRRLTLKSQHLYQTPIKALDNQFEKQAIFSKTQQVNSKAIKLSFEPHSEFNLSMFDHLNLSYEDGVLTLGRLGWTEATKNEVRRLQVKEINHIDIYLDYSTVEIFINNGEYVMSGHYFGQQSDIITVAKGDFEVAYYNYLNS